MATRARRKDAGSTDLQGPKHNHVFREFEGINTQAARQAIKPGEFSWLENVQPIGHGNAVAVPDCSLALAAIGNGNCYYQKDFNINGINYIFCATDTGHAYQILSAAPYTVTEITTTATPELNTSGVEIAQWKDERIIIVDGVNYFGWDGTLLYQTGSVTSVTVTNAGSGYTTIPSVGFSGGGGAGATGEAQMQLDAPPPITAAGTSYVAGDVVTLTGGTGTPAQLTVLTVGGGGSIATVSVLDPGAYTVLPTAPVACTGAGSNDATFTPTYDVLDVILTNIGTIPYVSAPTVAFGSGAATGTAVLTTGPKGGEHVEVYAGRVWVSVNRTLNYSAPSSFTDFAGTGSGLTIMIDPTLHGSITRLISANNYLYFFGVTSVAIIGDVSVNASTGATTFSNTNISDTIGTEFSNAIIPYFRSILFANKTGVYSIFGSTPIKISDALDGVFRQILFTSPLSAGVFDLNNIKCAAFSFVYQDSLKNRNLIAIFFNKKWFVANQGDDKTIITGGDSGSVRNLYGTDGVSLFQYFARPDYSVSWKIQSAYWDMKDMTKDKQVTKFGIEMGVLDSVGTINLLLETLSSQTAGSSEGTPGGVYEAESYDVPASGEVLWINDSDEIVPWQNDNGDVVHWIGDGYFLDMEDGEAVGKYVGVTLSSSDIRGNLYSLMLEYTFRDSW